MPTRKSTSKPTVTKSKAKRIKQTEQAALVARTIAGQHRVQTIIYVHGIGNKPRPEILKCQWDEALFGFNLGDRSRLAYWVNRVFYPEPALGSCNSADSTRTGSAEITGVGAKSVDISEADLETLLPTGLSPEQHEVLARLAERTTRPPSLVSGVSAADFRARLLPLPRFMREFITGRITKAFLKDVHELFFVPERREVMRRSLLERLETGGGPFVIIGHSQGSIVAYDVLSELSADQFEIDLFVTIGSPLGLKEVQDQLKKLTGQRGRLAVPSIVRRWVNVADPLDPVCADKFLAGDYAPNAAGTRVKDFVQWNADSPRDPHSGTGYLRLGEVKSAIQDVVQPDLFQPVAHFTIARDLVGDLENGDPFQRHPVLIELLEERPDGTPAEPLDKIRGEVVKRILAQAQETEEQMKKLASADEELVRESKDIGANEAALEKRLHIERLTHYVSADLTRAETERMAADPELRLTSIYRIFRNSAKRALLKRSIETIQATSAHGGYGARGQGITWAVLDSGIDRDHPHFKEHSNIHRVFDCLEPGPVIEYHPQSHPQAGVDRHGHGTHVAGIIAGVHPSLNISGIAPRTSIVSYKVLDDEGGGSDAKIIKALDHLFDMNQSASQQVVHGVNLSLGGPFDPRTFGCGDSPVCKQLRRLWRQGVVVVIAAGNEGYLELSQGDVLVGTNMDISIGDPANLEEAIAVGSIHKSKPHTYGVSYFSSRGPTADGRGKPDLVAPGERILSCRSNGQALGSEERHLYVELSGTSMAAPHVSGVIACFLSARTEFIGYPDLVRQFLLANCTDLKRDRMHQGAGMPNLTRMLLNT